MRMVFILTLVISTVCWMTTLTTITEKNTTIDEPGISEPLGPDQSRTKDISLIQSNAISNLQPESSHFSAAINDSVGPGNNGKSQIQDNTLYEMKPMFVISRSTKARLESRNNFSKENYTTNTSPIKTLSDDLQTQKRQHFLTRSSPISENTSMPDKNVDRMNNALKTTQYKHHYTSDRGAPKPEGYNTLEYESERMLPPFESNPGPYLQRQSFDSGYIQCSCYMTTCNYSGCNLSSVPPDLSVNVTVLLLHANNLEVLPSNKFLRYYLLEILDLSYNAISFVGDGAFNGLSRLTSLDLSSNLIGRDRGISDKVFEPLKSLKILRLYVNDFPCDKSPPVQDKLLAYLHGVEELYIDNYGHQEYGPGFKNMTSLRNLTFSCLCSALSLSNTSFINLQHITFLNISECNIHGSNVDVGAFAHLKNLKILDISENKAIEMEYLSVILRDLQNSSLQVLIMDNIVSDFSVNFINSSVTQYLPRNLTTLSARANNIVSIDRDGFSNLPKTLQYIDLSNNFMMMQAMYLPLEILSELEVLLVNTDLKQCLSNDRNIQDLPVGRASAIQHFKTHTKKQTDEDKIRGKVRQGGMKIPEKLKRIQINVQSMHETFLFNIDYRNSLEEIDLRCSVIPDFNFLDMVNFPNLRYLNLGRSSVQKLNNANRPEKPPIKVLILESNRLNDFLTSSETPFLGLNNLSSLDLSLNEISSLRTDLFCGLDNVKYLRLDGNSFSFFGANISNMNQLKLLNISNTALSFLPNEARSHINHLCRPRPAQLTVDMSGCPIQCDCFNLDFLKWMVKSPAFDQNFSGYKCRYADTSIKYILDGYKETIGRLDRECAENYPMFLVILAATVILLCAVTGAVVYRFRWKIRYLYYAAYLKVMDNKKKNREQDFNHDVFIVYDSGDHRFVARYLAPELENRGLKLLIHCRDFMAGTYIASNIVMAVAESRKTLVVLTRNLLESTWCNYEIQMATMEAVHTGRQVLVFLLKENIPNRELDVELLRYIKNNTYLPYPSPEDEGDQELMKRFYDKLAHDLER